MTNSTRTSSASQDRQRHGEPSTDRIDRSNPHVQPRQTAIPMWVVGARRPADRERRKNPGALGRHEQAQSGAPSASCLQRRSSDQQPTPPPERYRSGSEGGKHQYDRPSPLEHRGLATEAVDPGLATAPHEPIIEAGGIGTPPMIQELGVPGRSSARQWPRWSHKDAARSDFSNPPCKNIPIFWAESSERYRCEVCSNNCQ